MPEKLEEFMRNLTDASSWARVFITGIFVLFLYFVLAPLVIVTVAVQTLFNLLSSSSNSNLIEFSKILVEYIKQILDFTLYRSDEKPFPFSGFPASSGKEEAETNVGVAPAKASPRRKAKPKKSTKKKIAKGSEAKEA
jgi:hypothetical protein